MKSLHEVLKPKAQGERLFFNSHENKKKEQPLPKGTKPATGGTESVDRTPYHGYNPGEDEKVYDFGTKPTTPDIQAVAEAAPDAGGAKRAAKTNNPKNGFYGSVKGDKDKAWAAMHVRINKLTGEANDTKIRDFLDSDHGRHVARTLAEPDYDGDGEKKVDSHIKTSWGNFSKTYKPSMFMQVREEAEELTERKHHKHKKENASSRAARYAREKNEHSERAEYHRRQAKDAKSQHAMEWHNRAASHHDELSHHFAALATHHYEDGDK